MGAIDTVLCLQRRPQLTLRRTAMGKELVDVCDSVWIKELEEGDGSLASLQPAGPQRRELIQRCDTHRLAEVLPAKASDTGLAQGLCL